MWYPISRWTQWFQFYYFSSVRCYDNWLVRYLTISRNNNKECLQLNVTTQETNFTASVDILY